MKYIINKTVIFDSNKLALCLYENMQIVARLTKPATRLLLELIQKSGVTITREALLENVWTTYGFTASNAGLNNYIHELRKAFTSLGCHHELIITIPKLGFRFVAEIDILDSAIISSESAEEVKAPSMTEGTAQVMAGVKPDDHEAASFLHRRLYFFLAAIFLFNLCFFFFKNSNNDSYAHHKIGKIDSCNVYVLGKTYQENETLSKISALLKREDIDCKSLPSDVFYHEDRIGKHTLHAALISVCSKPEDKRYDACFNIKSQRNTSK